ncbi:hypothetical protein ACP8HZ_03980 [Francisella noatunensis]
MSQISKSYRQVLANRKNVQLVSFEQAKENADVLVSMVKHREFIGLKSDKLVDFVNL